jgi:nucleotidyltransferase substrate binding protein (TIGR01987 family)
VKKYENFCRALANLEEGVKLQEPYTIVEQTGIIRLFEICFQQSWKVIKAVLEEHGRTENRIGSPRAILKLAYQCGMISDSDGWLKLLEARNVLAHTYSDEQSLAVISDLKLEYIELFRKLKAELDENWMGL